MLPGVVCFVPPGGWSSALTMKDWWSRELQFLLEGINPVIESWASCHVLLGTAEGKRLPSYVQLVLTSCVDGECMSCFLQHDLASTPDSI